MKEYDREDVLDKATTLFWEKGFEAASMTDLVQATGLNTASMYKEFGSKEGLYDAALLRYRERWLEQFIRILSDHPNVTGIRAYIASLLENSIKPDYKGCLMINTIAEADMVSQKAIANVEKFCVRLETMLVNAIRNAQQQGDIPPQKNPVALAQYIVCFMHGLVLYGRLEDNRKNIPDITRTLMDCITK